VLQGGDQDVPPHTKLSDREYQIFQAIVAGDSVTDIAQKLNLSVKTVSTHKTHILEKMASDSVADLVRYAIQHKLLPGGAE
jgi:DNA-binding NarL/FixJ family response regulator